MNRMNSIQSFQKSRACALKEYLISNKIITNAQIIIAEEEALNRKKSLEDTLVFLQFIDADEMQKILSFITGIPFIQLSTLTINFSAFNLLPSSFWKDSHTIPFYLKDNILSVAMADPENIILIDTLREALFLKTNQRFSIKVYHESKDQIRAAIDKTILSIEEKPQKLEGLEFLQGIFFDAVRDGVSDIHIQPDLHPVRIRFRYDGILKTVRYIHKTLWRSLVICIKVMAEMDISEIRKPQSGRFYQMIYAHHVDFRVSSHPTIYGESLVIRILDRNKEILKLDQLGFSSFHIQQLRSFIQKPKGMVLLSGPTGSGKTTTLYALFSEIDRETRNIMTLEDPVEYQLEGVRQTEIREGILSFPEGVRSILRQDPDIIFIGEIRDEETAQMALRSSMTGHLVFSTIHTNDTTQIPARLIDFGLSPNLLVGNILATVAQRLVRRCCSYCLGKKCDYCFQSGYKGRVAIAEIIPFDKNLDFLVAQGESAQKIREKSAHYPSLAEAALEKLTQKITTKEEISRVLGDVISF